MNAYMHAGQRMHIAETNTNDGKAGVPMMEGGKKKEKKSDIKHRICIKKTASSNRFRYPAADDELDRFDSCRTGIRDGRLVIQNYSTGLTE